MTTTKEDHVYVLVPVEPTKEMLDVGVEYFRETYQDIFNSKMHYQLMIGTAPKAESYEKKLAAEYMRGHADGLKGGEIVDCTGELQHQLSEANARNARLVEVLRDVKASLVDSRGGNYHLLESISTAISANSEADCSDAG